MEGREKVGKSEASQGAANRAKPTFFLEFTAVFAVVALVLVLAGGFALTGYLGNSIRNNAIDGVVKHVEEDIAPRVSAGITPQQLQSPLTGGDLAEFDSFVRESVLDSETVRFIIWNADGEAVYAEDPAIIGQTAPSGDHLQVALAGNTATRVEKPQLPQQAGLESYDRVLGISSPLRAEGSPTVIGAVEVYQDYGPIAAHISNIRTSVFVSMGIALAVLYVAMALLVRRGSNTIRRQQADLQGRTNELKTGYESIVAALSAALDLRDHVTVGHARRVSDLASVVAWQMGLRKEQLRQIQKAAILHDIGKIGIADEVLSKSGPLDQADWDEMKRHPELGYRILKDIDFLRDVAEVVHAHHERYDGSGYPRGLKGEEIPQGARVFAVVDAYDAMTSHRPYRKPVPHQKAVQEVVNNSGSQFDPAVVQAFLEAARRGLLEPGPRDGHERSDLTKVDWSARTPSLAGE